MNNLDRYKKDIEKLVREGEALHLALSFDNSPELIKEMKEHKLEEQRKKLDSLLEIN